MDIMKLQWYVVFNVDNEDDKFLDIDEWGQLKIIVGDFVDDDKLGTEKKPYFFFDSAKQLINNFIFDLLKSDKVIEKSGISKKNMDSFLSFFNFYGIICYNLKSFEKKTIADKKKNRFKFFIKNYFDNNNSIINFLRSYYSFYIDNSDNVFGYLESYKVKKKRTVICFRPFFSSVQIYDKLVKLIVKVVLLNSKFFFLNNVKYNYTLLKFCDKTMKVLNSILLFCLLCGIDIPHYCFHSDLSIAGNCRMCLIQMDTSIKPIASCAVNININSTIYTDTKMVKKAREGVLEFLLVNHPLDCPICDQGGECDLQEQTMSYGNDRGSFLKKVI